MKIELKKRDEDLINIDIYTPSGKGEDFDSTTSLWEDEDTRQFYECLPDLKLLIPGILYKPTSANATTSGGVAGGETTSKPQESTTSTETTTGVVTATTTTPATPEEIKYEIEKMERELQELEKQEAAAAAAASVGAGGGGAQGDISDLLPPSIPIAELDEKESTSDSTGGQGSMAANTLSGANLKVYFTYCRLIILTLKFTKII